MLLLLFFKDKPKGHVATETVQKKKPKGESWVGISWNDAVTYCDTLSLGGFDNWCLSDVSELSSIYKNKERLSNIILLLLQDTLVLIQML